MIDLIFLKEKNYSSCRVIKTSWRAASDRAASDINTWPTDHRFSITRYVRFTTYAQPALPLKCRYGNYTATGILPIFSMTERIRIKRIIAVINMHGNSNGGSLMHDDESARRVSATRAGRGNNLKTHHATDRYSRDKQPRTKQKTLNYRRKKNYKKTTIFLQRNYSKHFVFVYSFDGL